MPISLAARSTPSLRRIRRRAGVWFRGLSRPKSWSALMLAGALSPAVAIGAAPHGLPASKPGADTPAPTPPATGYYREAASYGTRRLTEPPSYAKPADKTWLPGAEDIDWLDVGLDYRVRYEYRDDDIRRARSGLDQPLLLRTRAYLRVRDVLDPLRLAVELEDARRYNSAYERDTRDVNEFEPIQAYAELYFDEAFGKDDLGQARPFSLKFGNLAFEFLDRRLIGKNEWRNTTNNFRGVYAAVGAERNDFQLDLLALQPIMRDKYALDRPDTDQWFYGVIGHWRKWSELVTLEPVYLGGRQAADPGRGTPDRDIHSLGLRAYGFLPGSAVDFDFSAYHQFGRDAGEQRDAQAFTAEAGYTFAHAWKPRLSLFYGYASGDRRPGDGVNNRFERFYGFARPWSADDYIVFENLSAPKIRLEFAPSSRLRIDTGYGGYWLASDTDRLNNLLNVPGPTTFNRDRSGASGDFVGHGFDLRARYRLNQHFDATLGYAHFVNGGFVEARQRAARGAADGDSDFLYVELSLSAF